MLKILPEACSEIYAIEKIQQDREELKKEEWNSQSSRKQSRFVANERDSRRNSEHIHSDLHRRILDFPKSIRLDENSLQLS